MITHPRCRGGTLSSIRPGAATSSVYVDDSRRSIYTASGNALRIHIDLPVPRGPSSRKLLSSGAWIDRANTRHEASKKDSLGPFLQEKWTSESKNLMPLRGAHSSRRQDAVRTRRSGDGGPGDEKNRRDGCGSGPNPSHTQDRVTTARSVP